MSGEQLDLLGKPKPEPAAPIAEPEPPPEPAAAAPPPIAEVAPEPAPAAPRRPRRPSAPKKARSSAPEPSGDRPTLYLVDGPNIAFRAHYAPMAALTNSSGFPTKALFGYSAQLLRLIREYRPDMLVLCWDPRGDSTFRNELYPEYKGTRPDMPDELRVQMDRFPDVAEALGLCHIVIAGYEADDVMGTLAVRYSETHDVTIVSGDKDLMQLVDDDGRVTLLDTMKDQRIGPDQVVERWGVPPERIIDMLALMGDTSDNIPGVARIGAKGAAQLVQEFESLEAVFDGADGVKGRNRKPLLAEGARESAFLSQDLATIRLDVEVPLTPEDMTLRFPPQDPGPVTKLFQELEFHRFLDELGGEMRSLSGERYELVTDLPGLRSLITTLAEHDEIGLDVLTSSPDGNRADLVGLAFCVDDKEAWYVPLGHVGPGAERQIPVDRALLYLRAILESPAKRFVGGNLQFAATVLARHGVHLGAPVADSSVASFLLNSERKTHELPGLALTWLRHKMVPPKEALKQVGGKLADLDPSEALRFAAEGAHVARRLRPHLDKAIDEGGLGQVYREVDLPLVPVLSRLQQNGIRLDTDRLAVIREDLAVRAAAAERETWEHAGREFNSSSPKQLAVILFEELGLPVSKKTKTGPSTDASVLEELSDKHPLPAAILRYRSLTKLLSTYVDALPPLVDPATGRIHTHYSQTVAATGRLSSSDPNLQNIPIRTAEGRRIREAFVPEEGHVLLSADYSQVELRVMAHLCGGEGGFARAFEADQDVHRNTAAEVFDVAPQLVTSAMRSTAKAVNFGLIYGQTDFGLSRSLHISRGDARDYIVKFKERFPEIDRYMEETVASAKADRFVRTVTGRRRPVADLTSSNYNHRQAAQRVAINTPVQGSAADIIKLAMLGVDRMLRDEFPDVRMLLQVHDELVFEVPTGQVDRLRERVVEEMESAYPLRVPLRVDTGVGHNWDEAH
jgi:DNA polymerase I